MSCYFESTPPVVDGPIARWQAMWRDTYEQAGDDAVSRLARTQGFVLTTAQLGDLGVTKNDIRREVRRGRWWVPIRGAIAPIVPAHEGVDDRRLRHALTV